MLSRILNGATAVHEGTIAKELANKVEELQKAKPTDKVVNELRVLAELCGKAAPLIGAHDLTGVQLAATAAVEVGLVTWHSNDLLQEMDAYEAGASAIDAFWKQWNESRQHVLSSEQVSLRMGPFQDFLRETLVRQLQQVFRGPDACLEFEEAALVVKTLDALIEARESSGQWDDMQKGQHQACWKNVWGVHLVKTKQMLRIA